MIEEFQDAILEAQADVMEALREVGRDIVLPMIEQEAKKKWAQMSDEEKERFKAERPEDYAAFMEGLKR